MNAAEKEWTRANALATRQRVIAELERERGARVLTLIHRREPWAEESDEATKRRLRLKTRNPFCAPFATHRGPSRLT